MELWKDIKGYEGKYQISSEGRVRSLNYNHSGKPRTLKLQNRSNGYLCVCLVGDSKHKHKRVTHAVHRLVAEHFIPNPYGLELVLHKNDIKSDNRVYNLKWGTYKENNDNPQRFNRRRIKCIDKNKVFGSSFQAAEWLQKTRFKYSKRTNYVAKRIRCCCNGDQSIAFGLKWKYIDW